MGFGDCAGCCCGDGGVGGARCHDARSGASDTGEHGAVAARHRGGRRDARSRLS